MTTLLEYQLLAQRTSNTSLDDKPGHGYMGLIGECGELVDIMKKQAYMGMPEEIAAPRYLDECGDFCWYLAEMAVGLRIEMNADFDAKLCEAIVDRCPQGDASPLDLMFAVTRQPVDVGSKELAEYLSMILEILRQHGYTLAECLNHNIEKLRKRYPDGFDAKRSNDRYKEV